MHPKKANVGRITQGQCGTSSNTSALILPTACAAGHAGRGVVPLHAEFWQRCDRTGEVMTCRR
jgi:hypothetical protein